MHSLSDFRLRIPWRYGDQPWFRSLEKILWSVYDSEFGNFDLLETNYWRHNNVHFRLQTLYCDKDLNLSRIMRSQTELQILGICYDDDEDRFLGTLKRLHNAQLHIPAVVTLEYD